MKGQEEKPLETNMEEVNSFYILSFQEVHYFRFVGYLLQGLHISEFLFLIRPA